MKKLVLSILIALLLTAIATGYAFVVGRITAIISSEVLQICVVLSPVFALLVVWAYLMLKDMENKHNG